MLKSCLVLFLAVSSAVAVESRGATLTRNGKATSIIVVPDKAPRVCQEAAELLQKTVAKISGAIIPIQPEGRASAPASTQMVWVSVGNTRFARSKGVKPDAMKPEEIRLLVADSYVIAAGNEGPAGDTGRETQRGPYFASVELLERLGVRWLWPGESGEVLPKTATVTIAPLSYTFVPPLIQRYLRFGPAGKGGGEFRYGVKIPQAGLDWGDWPQHMRLGGSRKISAGHNFGDWYDKYFKEHPEYFAVGEDGKSFGWLNETSRSKLCVSNPAVLDRVVEEAEAYYEHCANPLAAAFSLSPTDNQAGHCMCQNCRKLDALDGPKVTWNFNTGENGRTRTPVHHVSLTDRYVTFWNRVAERLEQKCPHLLFGSIAYGVYRHPPLHVAAHRNVVMAYVGGDYTNDAMRSAFRKDWDAWAAKTSKMLYRPNLMREGYGFPLIWPTRMAEDLQHLARTGMIGVDIPNIHGHWATQGLNYYVLAKILWNPSLDARQLVDDYCDRGFGPAAAAVKKYYSRLMELTAQLAAHNGKRDRDVEGILARGEATEEDSAVRTLARTTQVSPWEVVYSPKVMMELEEYLVQARRLAAGQPAARKRVEFLSLGFEYARRDLKMKQAVARYERDSESREKTVELLKALVELEEWRKQQAASPAVGIVVGYYWFWKQQLEGTPAMRFAPVVVPEKLPGGDYRLSVLAFSWNKRITKMQLSADGKEWSESRAYEPRISWRGRGSVFVRFYLEGERDAEWSKPVSAKL